jgi:hypothetical protein
MWSLEGEDALLEPLYRALIPFNPDYARMLNQLLLSTSRVIQSTIWVDKIDAHKRVKPIISKIVVEG